MPSTPIRSALIRVTAWQVYRHLSGRNDPACAIDNFGNQHPNDSRESTGHKGHVLHMRRRQPSIVSSSLVCSNRWLAGRILHSVSTFMKYCIVHRIKVPIFYNREAYRSDPQSVT